MVSSHKIPHLRWTISWKWTSKWATPETVVLSFVCFMNASNSMRLRFCRSLYFQQRASQMRYQLSGTVSSTSAPLGGGQNLPPPGFPKITPKPLQVSTQSLVYHILHQFEIEWPNLFISAGKFLRNWRFCGATSRQIWPKSVQCKEIRQKRVFKQTAQRDQYKCKITFYKMVISKFQNFEFLTPKISKTQYFLKKIIF